MFFPTYRMLIEVWRELITRLLPATRRATVQEHRIELYGGGLVEMWSLSEPNSARGRKYARAIIDEAAMIPDLEHAYQAVIRPTMADYAGDAWLMSTPRGRDYFASLFELGQRGEPWMSWQYPTHANPYIPPEEIEAMHQELPATVYAQEVLAEIVDGGLTLFSSADIARAECHPRTTTHGPYLTSVDVGRRHDATVINTFDTSRLPYQRVAFERLERVPYPFIQQQIEARVQTYPGELWIESNGIGDPLIENLEVPAEPFVTTAKSKVQALQSLQLLLERGELAAQWDARERAALIACAWDDDHTADEVMSLAIGAQQLVGGIVVPSLPAVGGQRPILAAMPRGLR